MNPFGTKVDRNSFVMLPSSGEPGNRPLRHHAVLLVLSIAFLVVALLYGWQLHRQSKEIAELKEEFIKNQKIMKEMQQKCQEQMLPNNATAKRRTARSLTEAFMGTHLVGIRDRNTRLCGVDRHHCEHLQIPAMGNFFVWSSDTGSTFPSIRIDVLDQVIDPVGTFIVVRADGYYYVYSQITYAGTGMRGTGHETVQLNGDEEKVLMSFIVSQKVGGNWVNGRRRRPVDTGYHGGVFYLYANDKIGVRPVNVNVGNERFIMEKSKAFFGAYFLHT